MGTHESPGDAAQAESRETGGTPQPEMPDRDSTTGTTPNETFVGRTSGRDAGYTGRTGAEARAEEE